VTDGPYAREMHSIQFLTAVENCQTGSAGSAAVGFVIIGGFIAAIVALAVSTTRARSRLQIANAELAFLRPENARLQQWVAAAGGAQNHGASTLGASPWATSPEHWGPDPSGRHQHRYWDGSRWSDQVADSGVMATDPLDG
jgi:hypothetical protein